MLILVTLLTKGMFAIGCRPRVVIHGRSFQVFGPWMEDGDGYGAGLLELPGLS
jgi:hypothetical protein